MVERGRTDVVLYTNRDASRMGTPCRRINGRSAGNRRRIV